MPQSGALFRVYLADQDGRFVDVNRSAYDTLGYTREELLGLSVPDISAGTDKSDIADVRNRLVTGTPVTLERTHVRIDGTTLPVEVRVSLIKLGRRQFMLGIVRDLTDRKRAESLVAGQNRVLELIAQAAPQSDVLTELCEVIEEQLPGMLAAVRLTSEDRRRRRHGAAPSLPDGYNQALHSIQIGPTVGSCGTAAYRGQRVIVADIANDPLWDEYRNLGLQYGLRACWSQPIFSSSAELPAARPRII